MRAVKEGWYSQEWLEGARGWGKTPGLALTWLPRGLAKHFSLKKAGSGRHSGTEGSNALERPLGEKGTFQAGPQNGGITLQRKAPVLPLSTAGWDCAGNRVPDHGFPGCPA